MLKKLIQRVGILSMVALLMCTFGFSSAHAEPVFPEGYDEYNCSIAGETECRGAILTDGSKRAVTSSLYVPAGKLVVFSCYNSGTKFQVTCQIFNSSGQVVKTLYAAASPNEDGNDYEAWYSPGASYYAIVQTGDYTSNPYEGSGYTEIEYSKL